MSAEEISIYFDYAELDLGENGEHLEEEQIHNFASPVDL